MAEQNWQHIKAIFTEALKQHPEERSNFLDRVCGADEHLRREVDSLLDSLDSADNFMESPAVGEIANQFVSETRPVVQGSFLGHYEIIERIGKGGSGDVYLANDTKLHRCVALKILRENLSWESQAKERLLREARAVAKLDHPNICAIYEISETDDCSFIVMQYVEGETLADILTKERLSVEKSLNFAIQISEALEEAHSHNLIHRDIKPSNIVVNNKGQLKVLDFGLAKFIEAESDKGTTQGLSSSGAIMGTVPYMSPEQLRGKTLDSQTDIFSFGVVFYEMLSGISPFQNDSQAEAISAILNDEPDCAKIPTELQPIVQKCLMKDKNERYQTIKELLTNLNSLHGNSTFDERLGKSPRLGSKNFTGQIILTTAEAQKQTAETERKHNFTIKHRRKLFTVGLSALLFFSILSFGFYKFSTFETTREPFQRIKLTRLTNTGNVNQVALSPDGNLIVYETDEKEGVSIQVRQIEMSNSINLVPPRKGYLTFLTFSPDGKLVYYGFFSGDKLVPELYSVPALGGVIRKIPNKNSNFMSFAPDGKRFAQVILNSQSEENSLVINNIENLEETFLTRRKKPRSLNVVGKSCSWSPDGKIIAAISNDTDAEGHFSTIIGVSADDGAEKTLSKKRWNYLDSVQWLKDGSGLLVIGSDAPQVASQIWFVSAADGEARMLTNDFSNYSQIDATANGDQIVAVQESQTSSLWRGKTGQNFNDFKELSAETSSLNTLVLTANGSTVFRSGSGRKSNLWAMRANGNGKKQITVDIQVDERGLCATPDGKQVVFPARKNGKVNLWRVDADGGEVRQITSGDGEFYPLCAPDNRSIIYQKGFGYGVVSTLWKIPLEGGEPTQLTNYFSMRPALSPDGQRIAFFYITEDKWHIGIVSSNGGAIEQSVDVPVGVTDRVMRWSPDGESFLYVANEGKIGNVWSLFLNGKSPKKITDFNSHLLEDFALSPDGKEIFVTRTIRFNDVVSISEQ